MTRGVGMQIDVDKTVKGNLDGIRLRQILRGHKGQINQVAWSPDGNTLASSSEDRTVILWDIATGGIRKVLKGYGDVSYRPLWSPDGRKLATLQEGAARLWDDSPTPDASTGTRALRRLLNAHRYRPIMGLAWSPDGQLVAVALGHNLIQISDVQTARWKWRLKPDPEETTSALGEGIRYLSWSPNGQQLAAVFDRSTICFWETGNWKQIATLNTLPDLITGVTWSPDGAMFAVALSNNTIELWNAKSGMRDRILEGHTHLVTSLSFSFDGSLLASKSWDNTVRLWRCGLWEPVAILEEPCSANFWAGLAFHPQAMVLATLGEDAEIRIWDMDPDILHRYQPRTSIEYVNAKVVLVGESSVGKSALAIRIAEGKFRTTASTHGAQFWQIPLRRIASLPEVQRELALWDLAGQPDYRLVHQLFLDDTDVALVLFDCSDPTDPFRGIVYWAKALGKHAPSHALRFLVSARCDVSPLTANRDEINQVLAQYGFQSHFRTSARTGEGVDALIEGIVENIPWDRLPRTTTPRLFQLIRGFLLERKEAGDSLISMSEIQNAVQKLHLAEWVGSTQIDTVVSLLQARGLVYRLDPASNRAQVLLRPDLINHYASSIIQAARNHPRGIGAISERDVLAADIPLVGFERVEMEDETNLLEATVELLLRHDLCFREMGLLVFPSQINITRPQPDKEHLPTEVAYRFSGSIEAIYASLVVRLSYTDYFKTEAHWRYAAEFAREGHRVGFAMRQIEEGTGELEIYFYSGVDEFDRVTFVRFVTDHLRAKGIDIQERIHVYCHACGKEVTDRDAIDACIEADKLDIPCQYCGAAVLIPRSIEERYRSDSSYVEKQKELAERTAIRRAEETIAFRDDSRSLAKPGDSCLRILHLSDIHLETESDAHTFRTQLETDLKQELKVSRLEYLVISGDIANHATESEYLAAFNAIDALVRRFGLDADRIFIVPGNHDLNWDLAEDSYRFVPKRRLPASLPAGRYIPAGDAGALLRDEELYQQRFANFNTHFYRKVYTGQEYPLDNAGQGILHLRPDEHLLFLGLNSAWEIDHHYRDRASINMDALSRALDQLQDSQYDNWLKIAVWHHPITGHEAMNDDFLQLLAVHRFQIVMHGHIHEAIEGYHKYDDKRGPHIIGAGTFGAPTREQVSGIPLQYNLLVLDPKSRTLTVQTRKKEKPNGAWAADARWGDKNNPVPRYTIKLQDSTFSGSRGS